MNELRAHIYLARELGTSRQALPLIQPQPITGSETPTVTPRRSGLGR